MKKFFLLCFVGGGIFLSYFLYLQIDPFFYVAFEKKFLNTGEFSGITEKDLKYIDSIPVVHLQGSGYMLGVQHGRLLKSQIHDIIQELNYVILKKNTLRGFLISIYLHEEVKKFDAYIPQIYREEMKGIADGAGVRYSDILFINVFDDLFNSMGCSSLAMRKTSHNSKYNILARRENVIYCKGEEIASYFRRLYSFSI